MPLGSWPFTGWVPAAEGNPYDRDPDAGRMQHYLREILRGSGGGLPEVPVSAVPYYPPGAAEEKEW